ncbi:protein GRAVITROPIC IN THE LIGHT 1-like [Typha latifolia]|uniref:protein GRAVITROPIC IN THE LIGHT 1-like n=1 Tax=Typha latifolia TaxID=4733 RepID=UPI003C2B6236
MEETISQPKDSKEVLISKVFNNISSLKAAYIQLQEAHTPYDPQKIQAADKLVIKELVKLSELKHSRDNSPKSCCLSPRDLCLLTEIQEQQNLLRTYEVMVKKYQSQIQTRESEILQLQKQVQDSSLKKSKLEKKLRQRGLMSREPDVLCGGNTFSLKLISDLFPPTADNVHQSIHDFSKLLIKMMKAAGWDLDAAANSISPGAVYATRGHKHYAFESYVCQRMFSGFHRECFSDEGGNIKIPNESFFHEFVAMRAVEPLDVLSRNSDSDFGKFCKSKYLFLIHPEMESSFFKNLDQMKHVISGGHPMTPFYGAFLNLAKSIWLLHRLTHSYVPKVKVFQVTKGSDFARIYMESVVKDIILGEGEMRPKVELMVMPGFIVGENIIKSLVYFSPAKHGK